MKGNCKLVDLPKSKEVIPNGYASASAKPGSVPNKLTHNGDLIPHYIQKDLHQKMNNAIKDLGLDKKGITVFARLKRFLFLKNDPKYAN